MSAFGIDFGTTNSVLAVCVGGVMETVSLDRPPGEFAELGFDRVLPTVLADSGGTLEFGWKAKRNPNKLAAVKRLFQTDDDVTIGSHHLKVEEAAAVFFRQIKERASNAGLHLDSAVVTIPANSRGAARYRTKVSAGLSGIEVIALLNEPTAAAMAYAKTIRDGDRVLVFDWGGGTLDVTVLQNIDGAFIEEASKGIQRLGGIDVDDAFAAGIRAKLPAGSGSRLDPFDLELAKVKLSAQETTVLSLMGGGTVEVTRGDLEDAIRPLIQRTREPVDKCLADLNGARIDHLVMVGGSSKIPMAQRYIRELLRLEPMADVDPMTAIAEGAALAAGILAGEVLDNDFFVGTEHALGMVVHNQGPDKPEFSVLIPRNAKLPSSATEGFTPTRDNQERVRVQIIEGDPDAPFQHEDNVILKEWDVELEPLPLAHASFSVTFEYDVDGILHVKAEYEKTGKVILDEELSFGAAGSKADLVKMRKRIDGLSTNGSTGEGGASAAVNPSLSPESQTAIRRARDKIVPFVDNTTQTQLAGLVSELEAASPDTEADARRALEVAIREHSYLL
ncbi:MAG: Hsp70 family protein [Sporichthyaceae bacterium]